MNIAYILACEISRIKNLQFSNAQVKKLAALLESYDDPAVAAKFIYLCNRFDIIEYFSTPR